MKASRNYRAANRYLKPSVDVRPFVEVQHDTVLLTLLHRSGNVKLLVEMTYAEARALGSALVTAGMSDITGEKP